MKRPIQDPHQNITKFRSLRTSRSRRYPRDSFLFPPERKERKPQTKLYRRINCFDVSCAALYATASATEWKDRLLGDFLCRRGPMDTFFMCPRPLFPSSPHRPPAVHNNAPLTRWIIRSAAPQWIIPLFRPFEGFGYVNVQHAIFKSPPTYAPRLHSSFFQLEIVRENIMGRWGGEMKVGKLRKEVMEKRCLRRGKFKAPPTIHSKKIRLNKAGN